jgi:hypothetical protein
MNEWCDLPDVLATGVDSIARRNLLLVYPGARPQQPGNGAGMAASSVAGRSLDATRHERGRSSDLRR